jgi:TetR/AcrR family transcriptional regulator
MARWNDAVLTRDEQYRLKRQAVIREAGRAFSREGFHGTSLEDIAKTLNVTKAALYHYVKGKHEILFECHKLAHDLGEEALDGATKEGKTGLEQLTLFLSSYIETLTGEFGSCVVLTDVDSLQADDRKAIIARRDKFDTRFRAIIADGIEDGSISNCDPKLADLLIMGAVNWIPKWFSPDGDRSGREIAEGFVSILVSGLSAKGS